MRIETTEPLRPCPCGSIPSALRTYREDDTASGVWAFGVGCRRDCPGWAVWVHLDCTTGKYAQALAIEAWNTAKRGIP